MWKQQTWLERNRKPKWEREQEDDDEEEDKKNNPREREAIYMASYHFPGIAIPI